MTKATRAAAVVLVTFCVAGCESHAVNVIADLDADRNVEIQQILRDKGTRIYDMDVASVHNAMLITMRNLSMVVEEQDASNGFIMARGPAPKPLSEEEWREVRRIEEPKLKDYSILFSKLTTQGTDYFVNVITLKRPEGKVEINLGFRLLRTGARDDTLYTNSGPPTAVSMIVDKVWNEFERVASVQKSVSN